MFLCFYMIRLGSTKKGRLRPSTILQQNGNHLGKKNIPFLHRQSWRRYQINQMFELPVTKGSGKSAVTMKDPVFVRWLGTLTTLRYIHPKPSSLLKRSPAKSLDKLYINHCFLVAPRQLCWAWSSWSCFMEKNTQIVNDTFPNSSDHPWSHSHLD